MVSFLLQIRKSHQQSINGMWKVIALLIVVCFSAVGGMYIEPDEFYANLTNNVLDLVIDVRSQAEWDRGHIEGATHVEALQSAATLPSIIDGCQGNCREIVVYCRTGSRAQGAIDKLVGEFGFMGNIYNGYGVLRWTGAGYPLVTGTSVDPPCSMSDSEPCAAVEISSEVPSSTPSESHFPSQVPSQVPSMAPSRELTLGPPNDQPLSDLTLGGNNGLPTGGSGGEELTLGPPTRRLSVSNGLMASEVPSSTPSESHFPSQVPSMAPSKELTLGGDNGIPTGGSGGEELTLGPPTRRLSVSNGLHDEADVSGASLQMPFGLVQMVLCVAAGALILA